MFIHLPFRKVLKLKYLISPFETFSFLNLPFHHHRRRRRRSRRTMFCIGYRNLSKKMPENNNGLEILQQENCIPPFHYTKPNLLAKFYIIFETIFLDFDIYIYFIHLIFSFLPSVTHLLVNVILLFSLFYKSSKLSYYLSQLISLKILYAFTRYDLHL